MYKKVDWDSLLNIDDTAYMLLIYNGYFIQTIYFPNKDFSFVSRLPYPNFNIDTLENYNNSLKLKLMMHKNMDSSELKSVDYYKAKKLENCAILVLVTRREKGAIKSYIVK
ncbi:MAG: hypothetical protein IT265_16035 [Saprospiraceae bacterium]|nr:hypothetical protein [Saprospiraceae bacterium]